LNTALRLEKQQIPGTMISIYWDTSVGKPQPYVSAPLRLQVFQSVDDLSHPGTKATRNWWHSCCILDSVLDADVMWILQTFVTQSGAAGLGVHGKRRVPGWRRLRVVSRFKSLLL
jgi:hypothetical protein